MHLIYVNEIGSDYKGQKQYEFIFSESYEIDMDEWFIIPSSATSNTKSMLFTHWQDEGGKTHGHILLFIQTRVVYF